MTTLAPILLVLGLDTKPAATTDSEFQLKRKAVEDSIKRQIHSWFDLYSSQNSTWESRKNFKIIHEKEFTWFKRYINHTSQYSPFNPKSSLYPDGIITPLWINKYLISTPAVAVIFHDLYESLERDPLGGNSASGLEKDHDGISATEITTYKYGHDLKIRNQISSVGSKMAVVFILKNLKPDSSVVEERLTFFRKTCGLDRSVMFTLNCLNDDGTLRNIEKAMEGVMKQIHEFSHSYFRDREKNCKKKKQKLGQSQIPSRTSTMKITSLQGWTIRYEFKLAVFSEFRQDYEGAIKFYENCYGMILELLHAALNPNPDTQSDIQVLSPRWYEARTLFDFVSMSISKLLLFTNSPVESYYQLQRHILNAKNFPEFASVELYPEPLISGFLGTDIAGGGSFVYWNWISNLYKEFGEYIEGAVVKTPKISFPYPPPGSSANPALSLLNTVAAGGSTWIGNAVAFGPFSSVNPTFTVQHAGYYFLHSARAAEERWRRYLFISQNSTGTLAFNLVQSLLPADTLETEKNASHTTIVIDLLTRSYENFKKNKSSRMTLFIASEIARVYQQSQQFDTALKFYDRIAKNYRKESWFGLLLEICRRTKECAVELRNHQVQLNATVEMLHPLILMDKADKTVEELLNYSGENVEVDMDQLSSFMLCDFQFQHTQGQVMNSIAFQLSLESSAKIQALSIDRVVITFTNNLVYCILNDGSTSLSPLFSSMMDSKLSLPEFEKPVSVSKVPLNLSECVKHVFQGSLVPVSHQLLQVISVRVFLKYPSSVSLNFKISDRPIRSLRPRWLKLDEAANKFKWASMSSKTDNHEIRIEQREALVKVDLALNTPLYTQELCNVGITVANLEKEAARVIIILKCAISPGSIDLDPESYFRHDSQSNEVASIIHFDFGVLQAGDSSSKSVVIRSIRYGERSLIPIVYLHLLSNSISIAQVSPFEYDLSDTTLLCKDFEPTAIKFEPPFEVQSSYIARPTVAWSDPKGPLNRFQDSSNIDKLYSWDVSVTIRMNATTKLYLENIRLTPHSSVVSVKPLRKAFTAKEWELSHTETLAYVVYANIDLVSQFNQSLELGFLEICWKRIHQDSGLSISLIELPKFEISPELLRIVADVPPSINANIPFTASYTIENMTLHVAELGFVFEASDNFVFSGYKQRIFRILPLSSVSISLNLFPLNPGRWPLPQLRVVKKSDIGGVTDLSVGITMEKLNLEKSFAVVANPSLSFNSKSSEIWVRVK